MLHINKPAPLNAGEHLIHEGDLYIGYLKRSGGRGINILIDVVSFNELNRALNASPLITDESINNG